MHVAQRAILKELVAVGDERYCWVFALVLRAFAQAYALGVAPLSLIYPRTADVEALPGTEPVPGIDATLWFAGYNHDDDNEMVDVYRYADARHWYEEHREDPDEPTRLNARSTLGQAKRQVRKQGWSTD